jgi:hypothetical protein
MHSHTIHNKINWNSKWLHLKENFSLAWTLREPYTFDFICCRFTHVLSDICCSKRTSGLQNNSAGRSTFYKNKNWWVLVLKTLWIYRLLVNVLTQLTSRCEKLWFGFWMIHLDLSWNEKWSLVPCSSLYGLIL